VNKSEIQRVAKYLIDRCGWKAVPHAKENIDWANASDDVKSARDWSCILSAIKILQDKTSNEVASESFTAQY